MYHLLQGTGYVPLIIVNKDRFYLHSFCIVYEAIVIHPILICLCHLMFKKTGDFKILLPSVRLPIIESSSSFR